MIPVPTGTLVERLTAIAALHERNATLCAPGLTSNGEVLRTANRHAAIHEQAAADIREAVSALATQQAVSPAEGVAKRNAA